MESRHRSLAFACRLTIILLLSAFFSPPVFAQVESTSDKSAENLPSQEDAMAAINPYMRPRMPIDEARVTAAGIRVIKGRYVTLYTDVRDQPDVDELPEVFDQAVPLWCRYFGVDVSKTKPYRLSAFVMIDKERFRKAGLIPDDLANFPAGFNRGHEMWLFNQPDPYYTRHLLIHEGTHAFMQWFGRGVGAPWYAEGMAELLSLHRWQNKQLSINIRLTDRTQSEGWGRPKLINEQMVEGKFKIIEDVLALPATSFRDVKSYAWAWAGCEFFSQHPLTKTKFLKLQTKVADPIPQFNNDFYESLRENETEFARIETDWRLFIEEMDYGYLVAAGATSDAEKIDKGKFRLSANRSWQSIANLRVKAGEKFKITASGRFQVGTSVVNGAEKSWICEANGITLKYNQGRPLGELHATVLPAGKQTAEAAKTHDRIAEPIVIGITNVVTVPHDGTLCLRINESPANLLDNKGSLEISVDKID